MPCLIYICLPRFDPVVPFEIGVSFLKDVIKTNIIVWEISLEFYNSVNISFQDPYRLLDLNVVSRDTI